MWITNGNMEANVAVISAKLSIGEIECLIGIRYNQPDCIENKKRSAPFAGFGIGRMWEPEMPTVRQFVRSPRERLTAALASAAIVRDVAALGALVLFGTMLVLVLSSADILV